LKNDTKQKLQRNIKTQRRVDFKIYNDTSQVKLHALELALTNVCGRVISVQHFFEMLQENNSTADSCQGKLTSQKLLCFCVTLTILYQFYHFYREELSLYLSFTKNHLREK